MAEFENKMLDWDTELDTSSAGESKEFTLLPEGDYPFTVVAFEQGQYSGQSDKIPQGCNVATVTLRLDGGEAGTADVKYSLFLLENQQWKMIDFFYGVGLIEKGDTRLPWSKLRNGGQSGRCKLGHRKGTRDGVIFHDIRRIYPPVETPKKAFKKGMF